MLQCRYIYLQSGTADGRSDCMSDLGKALLSLLKELGFIDDDLLQIAIFNLGPIGLGRRGESRRDGNAILGKLRHHLTQRRVLPADRGDVSAPQLVEPLDERRCRFEFFEFFHDFFFDLHAMGGVRKVRSENKVNWDEK